MIHHHKSITRLQKLSSGKDNLIISYALIEEKQRGIGPDTDSNVAAPILDGESRLEDTQAPLIHKDRKRSLDLISQRAAHLQVGSEAGSVQEKDRPVTEA